ncbi:OPT family oligopeptide transporter [Clostridium sp. MCC353]|uniref:OPT/YSL family transporter n=1 Tax=Clostridium sp. MCC353 TaxID=2592646 RepID=UPI001C0219AA|nr:OPT/YSL family transporter [Clostridium sp. MCC353]MBT9778253.1 OPT family oligopeptide transporter [Clostridium sp. MCC353]
MEKEKIPQELIIPASEHPKAYEPTVLVLNVVMCALGAIIGLELIVRTGVTPNTSIVGALFAILISRIPITLLKKYRSVHRQNLIQTAISGATFSAANCLILPIGIPVVMGKPELMFPMLIGVFLATCIDATILYKTFDSEMYPAEGAWPPGVAAAQSILAVVEKGRKAFLLIIGIAIGWIGKIAGIPTDLLGVSWFGDFFAMLALGVGSIIIGVIKTNSISLSLFGHTATLASNLFGAEFVFSDYAMINYMPHGVMIGAGAVSLLQCARMLFKKSGNDDTAAGKFTSSMVVLKKTLGLGFVAYMAVALLLAVICGIISDMSVGMFIVWLIFAAFAALSSELIVGISAMYSGWFPGFATALIFLIVGMLLGFPPLALAVLVGFTSATGPAFSDMAYDLKCGYILRGSGQYPELEKEGRKQQYYAEMMSFVIAFLMVAFLATKYFDQGLFAPVSKTFATTIDAGTNTEVAKWLLIWAIPGAIIQLIGGNRQIGILFATGLLVGTTMNGVTIIVGLIIRYIAVKRNKANEQILNILGAGALAGAAVYSFFTATLGLAKKK